MEYLEIGSSPADEECAQVGEDFYKQKATAECSKFIDLIRKKLGHELDGAKLWVKSNSHDFGTYYEVVCSYDERKPASIEYAFNVENNAPTKWE